MEENKNYEIEAVNCEPELYDEEESSGMGTGAAMVLGGGITLGIIAAVKLIQKHRAKKKCKEETEKDDDGAVIDADYEEVDEEEKSKKK